VPASPSSPAARRSTACGPRDVSVDLAAVRERKREIVETFRSGSERSLAETAGLEFLRGEARFVGRRISSSGSRTAANGGLVGDLVFLNVGARPAPLDLPGIGGVEP
jgi:pyruvate/2-oxoglutarate dehydrogenase complex dihydrolipoamide dehydrogenase (E3) component